MILVYLAPSVDLALEHTTLVNAASACGVYVLNVLRVLKASWKQNHAPRQLTLYVIQSIHGTMTVPFCLVFYLPLPQRKS
jgi:hypothetical protein